VCARWRVVQRIFYADADTHFDPPAAAIVVSTFLIAVLAAVDTFPQSVWVPTLGFWTVGNDRPSDYFLWLTLSQ
jgi:hypothetical protein